MAAKYKEANEVLCDPEKRKLYDQLGATWTMRGPDYEVTGKWISEVGSGLLPVTSKSGFRLTRAELTRLAHVHPDMIACLLEWGLLEPVPSAPDLCFSETAVPRVRRIMRLRKDLGINWAGIGVGMELLDRIESLVREIKRLRADTGEP